jgi:hypothetical protein
MPVSKKASSAMVGKQAICANYAKFVNEHYAAPAVLTRCGRGEAVCLSRNRRLSLCFRGLARVARSCESERCESAGASDSIRPTQPPILKIAIPVMFPPQNELFPLS